MGSGNFLKKYIFESVHSKEKEKACLGFLVKFFTKSIHSGGVTEEKNNISEQSI